MQKARLASPWQVKDGQFAEYSNIRARIYLTDSNSVQCFALHPRVCIQVLLTVHHFPGCRWHKFGAKSNILISLLE